MSAPADWPGEWRKDPSSVAEHHPQGAELAWIVRGYPFTRPVLALSNVEVRKLATPFTAYGPFVRVELMAGGFHEVDVSAISWFLDLEWLGPLRIPPA